MDGLGDLVCGTFGGVVGKFVDYPFDTVKTRLQANPAAYKSTFDCITKIARTEGFWGFYAGIMAPVFGAGFENATAFFLYGRTSALLVDRFVPKDSNAERPLWIVATAGAVAGFGTGCVLTPFELVKCRVQTNPAKYPSAPACFRKTIAEEGAGALMKGVQGTLLREVPGNACWFGFYELTLRNVFIPTGKKRDDAPWYAFPLSGAVGGFWYWTAFYPADTVKTRLQTNPVYEKMGFAGALRAMYREGGIPLLYAGIGITWARALPANATIFGCVEWSMRHWKNYFGTSATQ